MAVLVRPAEFALIRGVSKASVSSAMKDRIRGAIVEQDGVRWLDKELALELWNRNTKRNNNAVVDAPQAVRPPVTKRKPPADAAAAALVDAVMSTPDDQIPDRYDSEARKVHYQAELAKLQTLKERGELVPAAEVKARWFEHGRAIRDNLLSIPDRIASQLAASTDAREVHVLLSEEISGALRVLANG
jgi:hypothetical protein